MAYVQRTWIVWRNTGTYKWEGLYSNITNRLFLYQQALQALNLRMGCSTSTYVCDGQVSRDICFFSFMLEIWIWYHKWAKEVYPWYLKHKLFSPLVFFRLQDRPMLHTGQQPDVSGSAEWHSMHQDAVLCHHWSSLGSSVWDVPCPATPLPPRVHPQHPQWCLPRSEVIDWLELFTHEIQPWGRMIMAKDQI